MKTIKQIADEIGVSKQAVQKRINNLGLRNSLRKIGNQWSIDNHQENLIKQAFKQAESTTKHTKVVDNQLSMVADEIISAFAVLQEQLKVKDAQIEAKDNQISELNRQLCVKDDQITFLQQNATTAQVLHAGTIQKQLAGGENSSASVSVVTAPERSLFMRIFGRKQ